MTIIALKQSDFDTLVSTIQGINLGTIDSGSEPDYFVERHDQFPGLKDKPGSGFLITFDDNIPVSVQLMGTTLYFILLLEHQKPSPEECRDWQLG